MTDKKVTQLIGVSGVLIVLSLVGAAMFNGKWSRPKTDGDMPATPDDPMLQPLHRGTWRPVDDGARGEFRVSLTPNAATTGTQVQAARQNADLPPPTGGWGGPLVVVYGGTAATTNAQWRGEDATAMRNANAPQTPAATWRAPPEQTPPLRQTPTTVQPRGNAPAIIAGTPSPHAWRGACTNCHQILAQPAAQQPAANRINQELELPGITAQPARGSIPGVRIIEVGAQMQRAGLDIGDVVESVNGSPTPTLESFRTAMLNNAGTTQTVFDVVRDGVPGTITLDGAVK